VLLGSAKVIKFRHPSQMQLTFETQLSHSRTAHLWNMTLNMQPHLTSSALLSMAASAAGMLASESQSHRGPGSATAAVLLNTVVMGPQQLPSISQIRQDPGCAVLHLSLEVASGSISIHCSGASLMQSLLAQTGAQGSQATAAVRECQGSQGCPRISPAALACLLGPIMDVAQVASPAAAIGRLGLAVHDQSGYTLHPAVLEAPVSLRALTAAQTDMKPIWLKSAAATVVTAPPRDASGFTATAPVEHHEDSVCSSVRADCMTALIQKGLLFAAGHTQAAAAPAATGEAVKDSGQKAAVDEKPVPADSAMLTMDSQERKLYIQAQVHCFLNIFAIRRVPYVDCCNCCMYLSPHSITLCTCYKEHINVD